MCGVSLRGNVLEILETVKAYYGIADRPYDGTTYIIPDGAMLDMRECGHHSDIEKFLVDSGLSNEKYTEIGGSNTMRKLGAIRCNTWQYYFELPSKYITEAQKQTLITWLDFLRERCNFVTSICGKENYCYALKTMQSQDIVQRGMNSD